MRQLMATVVAVAASALAVLSPVVSGVSASSSSGSTLTVLQMNLCLSGQAGCYSSTTHRPVLDEATAQIDAWKPTAVTLNEACRGDAAELARRTGYELTFAAVDYGGTPLPCIDPRGRGLFGIAVLTNDDVTKSRTQAFEIQADPEERRWLCATTTDALTVCTAHLSTRYTSSEDVANDAECSELRQVLSRYDAAGTTLFGGDVNRQEPCAPSSMWAARDTASTQSPGVQHIYGSTTLASTSVVEATYTDHDFLLATATTARPR